jgi:hypothetical protein
MKASKQLLEMLKHHEIKEEWLIMLMFLNLKHMIQNYAIED